MDPALTAEGPPRPIRVRYWLWESRVPPTWLGWAEADIASNAWLVREVVRFAATFAIVSAALGRFKVGPLSLLAQALGAVAIWLGRTPLRRIAVAYQRYGWDWTDSPRLGVAAWLRAGYAVLFTLVFVLLGGR